LLQKGKDDGSKEDSRRVGNLGQERRSSEVRSGGKEVGTGEVSQMDKGVWEETVRKDADEKSVGPCDRSEGGIHTMKRKGIPAVERRERGGERICERTVAKGIYPAVEVTANSTGILCGEERWEETDGAGLQISE